MAGLDIRYMRSNVLKELFRDKETGLPLRNGWVYFWKDTSRTVAKPAYKITGSPPNYTYVPADVNGDGAVVLNIYGGFDYPIYYFPFTDDNEVELYYVEVYSEGGIPTGVFQFDVEAEPNYNRTSIEDVIETNFISNGQFLLHTDFLTINEDGEVDGTDIDLAYGGWKYYRNDTGATDYITFEQDSQYQIDPPDQPRYRAHTVVIDALPGDLHRDVVVRFYNVNRFSSDDQEYTLGFWIKSAAIIESGQVIINKNYGTGGDAPETILVLGGAFNITTTDSLKVFAFTFGSNAAKNVGTLNDDYVEVGFRVSLDELMDIDFTDFFLIEGNKIGTAEYPTTTNRQDITTALGGGFPLPAVDGSDLNLPCILTRTGWAFDASSVGSILISVCDTAPNGYLLADGASLITSEYQPDGVPNTRLFNKIFNTNFNGPGYGTGDDFFVCVEEGPTSEKIYFLNTTPGAATAASVGTSAFTIINVTDGDVASGINAFITNASNLLGISEIEGVPALSWTESGTSFVAASLTPTRPGTPLTKEVHRLQFNSNFVASEVLDFSSGGGSAHVYFQVDNVGVDPGGSGLGYRCNVESTDSAYVQMAKLVGAASARKSSTVVFVAASLVTAGEYFELYAKIAAGGEQKYVFWSTVDGAGTEPVVAGAIYIKVDLLSTDTARQVAVKHSNASNTYSYKLPDPRGEIVRFSDLGSNNDPGASERYNPGLIIAASVGIGTYQIYDVQQHAHPLVKEVPGAAVPPYDALIQTSIINTTNPKFTYTTSPSEYYGGQETVPENISFNAYIKY